AGAAKATQEEDKARKPNTRPSHELDDYVGDYNHPGYGTLKVAKAGENLVVRLNSLEFPLRHYHYDTFEFTNELFLQKLRQKLTFFTDARGNIGSLAVPFEPAVKEIVFVRAPDKNLLARDVLEKFVGQYEMAGVVLTCALKGEATLTLTVPGQTAFELVPARGTEFGIKGYQGLSIEFMLDESGGVTGAVFRTPNGIFNVKRK
ncbi:MAG: DUF3471 domain-containing protein, partial [Candidatus Aminicenantes bacterium]|nr:DUF3471 domain-containing protein [Candidatus Aminicenantes bacterium]